MRQFHDPAMKKFAIALAALLLLLLAAGALVTRLPFDDQGPASVPVVDPVEQLRRGAYLATVGDCAACHTTRGGAAYAGGAALATPFGAVYPPNITADRQAGIGAWSADDFWRALHNGKAPDGRLLYPAFPYTSYNHISRIDADALYAYFQTVTPSAQASQAHALRFPYNQQWALGLWRALYFRPAVLSERPDRSAAWNRGAYLVQGLGHCSACHSGRNRLGAEDGDLAGGLMPLQGWYAPSLTSDGEAGLGAWETDDIVALLQTGVSRRATVFGPMANVVGRSLQYLSAADANAMAVYLKSLPATDQAALRGETVAATTQLAAGARLYEHHCADCHGADGKGMLPAYPPLAGNRALTTIESANAIRIVLHGGFAPGTRGNPRPYGMPPFGPALSDDDVAALVSYLRNSWGNHAPAVAAYDVNRYRSVPLD
jgi:mono/diheme cytochrome c family protein